MPTEKTPAQYQLQEVARIPLPGDNCAIATRRLPAGTVILDGDGRYVTDYTILEGHRLAIRPIRSGESLLSWGLPFARAIRPIEPGNYVCNIEIIEAIRIRHPELELPERGNFKNEIRAFRLDEQAFRPGSQVPVTDQPRSFRGYRRPGGRGVGTRNYIVLLGTTSQTSSFVRVLADSLKTEASSRSDLDGITAVAHTEGGGREDPNNREFLLRTLAGFLVNPNVAAVLAVDLGQERITNQALRDYALERGYPLEDVPHLFMSLQSDWASDLERGRSAVRRWLSDLPPFQRSEEPAAELKLALQCGGSDAFSGISANPLLGWAAREVIRNGGAANLAETDELIGAEQYVLQNVRDLATARRFLKTMERFQERVAWHGQSAEGNPSGGNKYRGLYNITLKSIGAALKRNPDVRLDWVIDYAERMNEPGFYFMDSPGNDLESIAGQVASGANLIFFTTGNGSITNFPFVPTLKIMCTTRRYQLLSHEMDVNAGAYLDGTPMEELGRDLFEQTLRVASGEATKGELAGHSQVSIWRDWRQTSDEHLQELEQAPEPRAEAWMTAAEAGRADSPSGPRLEVFLTDRGWSLDQVGLILPTSLCAGQIARIGTERLNAREVGFPGISRFVALPHTEGCGVSAGSAEVLYTRTMIGYLRHPSVGYGLLLEHGCERTHNDYIRSRLLELGVDPSRFGWASIQLDGGLDEVLIKVEDWFRAAARHAPAGRRVEAGPECLRLGLTSSGQLSGRAAAALGGVARRLTAWGATLVVPRNATLLDRSEFVQALGVNREVEATLPYGEQVESAGLYIMETPTTHWVETITGLAATGVEIIAAAVADRTRQAHPLVPVLQIGVDPQVSEVSSSDLDLEPAGSAQEWEEQILDCILATASNRYTPRLFSRGNVDFQLTRGLLGVSL